MNSMTNATTKPLPNNVVIVKLSADDLTTLNTIADFEGVSSSDVLRRAVRAYAAQLQIHIDR